MYKSEATESTLYPAAVYISIKIESLGYFAFAGLVNPVILISEVYVAGHAELELSCEHHSVTVNILYVEL